MKSVKNVKLDIEVTLDNETLVKDELKGRFFLAVIGNESPGDPESITCQNVTVGIEDPNVILDMAINLLGYAAVMSMIETELQRGVVVNRRSLLEKIKEQVENAFRKWHHQELSLTIEDMEKMFGGDKDGKNVVGLH